MKRLIYILFVAFMLTSCAPSAIKDANTKDAKSIEENQKFDVKVNTRTIMDRAELVAELYRARDWGNIRAFSSEELANGLPDEKLNEVWGNTIKSTGAFKENIVKLPVILNDQRVVQLISKHENGYIQLTLSWTEYGQLTGFYVNVIEYPGCPEDCSPDTGRIAEALIYGQYENFFKTASEAFKSVFSDEMFANGTQQIREKYGEFIAASNLKPDILPHSYIYEATFEKGTLNIGMAFNENGELYKIYTDEKKDTDKAPVKETSDKWSESEISVVSDAKYPNKGLLTMPSGVSNPPVVVLVHGSGCHDMDETIYENKPFKDIAHGLGEREIATIRYNKRCKTNPVSANMNHLSIFSETIEDAVAAIRFAQSDSRLKDSKVYLLGHSQGGMVAPYIAAKYPGLSGIISVSGTLRGFDEVLKGQQRVALRELRESGKIPEEQIAAQEAKINAEMEKVNQINDKTPDNEIIATLSARYWRSMREVEGNKYISEVTVPVLVLQGSQDRQVFVDVDYARWLEVAKTQKNITCRLFDGLNHLMMPTTIPDAKLEDVQKDYSVPSHVDVAVIDEIANFVMK